MSAAERMSVAYLMTRLPAELVAKAYRLPVGYAERVAAKAAGEVGAGLRATRRTSQENGGNRHEER